MSTKKSPQVKERRSVSVLSAADVRGPHGSNLHVVKRVSHKLRVYLGRQGIPEVDRDDLVQEVLLALMERLRRKPDQPYPGWPWFQVTARNKIREWRRVRFRVPTILGFEPETDRTVPADAIEAQETIRVVGQCFRRLSPVERQVLEQCFCTDEPVRVVATRLGLRPKQAEGIRRRALQHLRGLVARKFGHGWQGREWTA